MEKKREFMSTPPIMEIEIVGPNPDLQQLKQDVNEAIEDLGTAMIQSVTIHHDTTGWFVMIFYKVHNLRGH